MTTRLEAFTDLMRRKKRFQAGAECLNRLKDPQGGKAVGIKAKRRGMVHVYTGDGKGKTTAALGLALRVIGHGGKVFMLQFMKGSKNYGEIKAAEENTFRT